MSKAGSVLGGILLITGSCVGAGMLGLPIQTGLSGFLPSLLSFLIVWLFMTTSGFMLLEANSWHPKDTNILTMISHSLGKVGRYICWFFYLFLFYALLVAYMAASGNILSHFLSNYFDKLYQPYQLTVFFVLLFGVLIYKGTKTVDHANRLLMFFKIAAFVLILFLGARFINLDNLSYKNTPRTLASIPILITAFGFHNMIPSLYSYMKGNVKRVKKSIIGGSIMSLVVYLLWQTLVLGIVPENQLETALSTGKEASEMISLTIKNPAVGMIAQVLGFFAILTSFLAQSLSLSHFLIDGLELKKSHASHFGACALTLLPPLVLAIFYPDLFYAALNFAGGICTVVLFGIIPCFMLWKGRYQKNLTSGASKVPGGKILILAVLIFSASIFINEIFTLLEKF
jgi:tyrosine-specific transport protein